MAVFGIRKSTVPVDGRNFLSKSSELHIIVVLLDEKTEEFKLQGRCTGRQLYQMVLKTLGVFEFQYFDLAYLDLEANHCWLDHSRPLVKLARTLGQTELEFLLSVKYYVPHPNLLIDDLTRYLFALQIKRDFFLGLLHSNRNTSILLAAFIIQSELGDYADSECKSYAYLRKHHLMRSAPDTYLMRVMELHQTLVGLTKADADFHLLDAARKVELYGVRLHPVVDTSSQSYNLGVTHAGIYVFQNFSRISGFGWSKIRKLSFKRRRFLLRLHINDQEYANDCVEYSFPSQSSCKNFWKKCIEQHSFFRSASLFNATDTSDRMSELLHSTHSKSLPSLKRLVGASSFEVPSLSTSTNQDGAASTSESAAIDHTTRPSTPLQRLARLRHGTSSLKWDKKTSSKLTNSSDEFCSCSSILFRPHWMPPDYTSPIRKGSVPTRPVGVNRLFLHNPNLAAEHFLLLRLSFTSLAHESTSQTDHNTSTLRKRLHGELAQSGRAASTPSIHHINPVKRKVSSHSFVPRLLDTPMHRTLIQPKETSCNSESDISEHQSFPRRPVLNRSSTSVNEIRSVRAVSHLSPAEAPHSNEPTKQSFRKALSSCSLCSEEVLSPIPLAKFSGLIGDPSSTLQSVTVDSIGGVDDSAGEESCSISIDRANPPKPYPSNDVILISSPHLTIPSDLTESTSESPAGIRSASFSDLSNGPETVDMLSNEISCMWVNETILFTPTRLHPQRLKISTFGSDALLISHFDENGSSPDMECISVEQDFPSARSNNEPSPPDAISIPAGSRSSPEVSDDFAIETARMLVSTSISDGIMQLEEKAKIGSGMSDDRSPRCSSPKLETQISPVSCSFEIVEMRRSESELSSASSKLTSEEIGLTREAPESLAEALSVGAISVLTGVSCIDLTEEDRVSETATDNVSTAPVASSVRSCKSLRQLGRGYWGVSDSSSDSESLGSIVRHAQQIIRSKSATSVCARRGSRAITMKRKTRRPTIAGSGTKDTVTAKCSNITRASSIRPVIPSFKSPSFMNTSILCCMQSTVNSERIFYKLLECLQTLLLQVTDTYECRLLKQWFNCRLNPLLQPLLDKHGSFLHALVSNLEAWEHLSGQKSSSYNCDSRSISKGTSDVRSPRLLSSSPTDSDCYTATHSRSNKKQTPQRWGGKKQENQYPLFLGQLFSNFFDLIELYDRWCNQCSRLISELWLLGYSDLLCEPLHPHQTDFVTSPSIDAGVSENNTSCISNSINPCSTSPPQLPPALEMSLAASTEPSYVRSMWNHLESSPMCIAPLLVALLQPGRRIRQYCVLLGGLLAQYAPDHPDTACCKVAFARFIQTARESYRTYRQTEQLVFILQLTRWILPMDKFLGIRRKSLKSRVATDTATVSVSPSDLEHLPHLHLFGWLKKFSKRGFQPRMVFLFDDRMIYASRIRGVSGLYMKVHGIIYLRNASVEKDEALFLSHDRTQYESSAVVLHDVAPESPLASVSTLFTVTIPTIRSDSTDMVTQRKSSPHSSLSRHSRSKSHNRSVSKSRPRYLRRKVVFNAPNELLRDAWVQQLSIILKINRNCAPPVETSQSQTDFAEEAIVRFREAGDSSVLCVPLLQQARDNHPGGAAPIGVREDVQTYTQHNLLNVCWRRHVSLSFSQLLNANDCTLHGFLYRNLQNVSRWQKLWTVLADFRLLFYKNPEDVQPQAILTLPGYTVHLFGSPSSREPRRTIIHQDIRDPLSEESIELSYNTKRYCFRAESHESLMSWFHSLSTILACSQQTTEATRSLANNAVRPLLYSSYGSAELVFTCSSSCQ